MRMLLPQMDGAGGPAPMGACQERRPWPPGEDAALPLVRRRFATANAGTAAGRAPARARVGIEGDHATEVRRSKKVISQNIRTEMAHGKPQKQRSPLRCRRPEGEGQAVMPRQPTEEPAGSARGVAAGPRLASVQGTPRTTSGGLDNTGLGSKRHSRQTPQRRRSSRSNVRPRR